MNKVNKIVVIFILVVYNFSFFGRFVMFFSLSSKVSAEEEKKKVNIVALLVEKKLYQNKKSEIKWYAKDYIQQKQNNTKALTIPIDKDNFKAKDVREIVENLYFEGEKKVPSSLEGIVLLGDLPLPVVKKNGFIFPSVYPYVDLENQKYHYSSDSTFFEYQEGSDYQPEIWHSIIKFENKKDYSNFFNKLKGYNSSPSSFVNKKFWYEDFIHLKEVFNNDLVSNYVNKLVFLEDSVYHRYTSLLLDILMQDYNSDLKDISKKYKKEIGKEEEKIKDQLSEFGEGDSLQEASKEYLGKLGDYKNKRLGSGEDSLSNLVSQGNKETSLMPTLMVKKTLKNFLKSYSQLFSPKYISRMRKNVDASGRWNYFDQAGEIFNDEADSHVEKVMLKDEISKNLIKEFNDTLENALDSKIQEEGYHMKIPVYQKYMYYKREPAQKSGEGQCFPMKFKSEYRNYYFGKYAGDVENAQDLSIYRGTYKNFSDISNLSGEKTNSQGLEDINVDLEKKSLGSSYGLFTRQIEANRGYNFLISQKDGEDFQNNRCSNDEKIDQWSKLRWGGASPINIDYDSGSLDLSFKRYNYKYAGYPQKSNGLGGNIYDMGGSMLIDSEKKDAYSYKAYKTYPSSIKVKDTNGNINYCQSNKILGDYKDFLQQYKNPSPGHYKRFNIEGKTKVLKSETCVCWERSAQQDAKGNFAGYSNWNCKNTDFHHRHLLDYNLISSIVEHKSVTKNEFDNLNMSTRNRPIDDSRYVNFQGVGGDLVKFIYPNLLNVEVYKKDGEKLILKSKEKIKKSLKDYLRKKAVSYKDNLREQLKNKNSYYKINSKAFDALASIDKLASPNRSYDILSKDFFVDLLGEEKIDIIAENLYYLNIGNKQRPYSSDILEDISLAKKNYNINNKFSYILENYLTSNTDSNDKQSLNLPTYSKKGYEAGYINSDGVDTLTSSSKPEEIQNIKNLKNNFENNYKVDKALQDYENSSNKSISKCGIPPDGAVIIWQWPDAFQCWLKNELTQFNLNISDKCSRGNYIFSDGGDDSDSSSCTSNGEGDDSFINQDNQNYEGFRMTYEEFEGGNFDFSWSEYQKNWDRFIGKDKQMNQDILSGASEGEKELIDEISNSTNISLSPDSINFEDLESGETVNLKISSKVDVGKLKISLAEIGDSCFSLNSTDLCKDNFIFADFNPYKSSLKLPLELSSDFDNKAGNSLFQFKVCKGDNGACFYKNKILSVNPGKLDNLKIITPTEKIVKGGKLPLKIAGFDKYGNSLGQIIQNYSISVNNGVLNYKGAGSNRFDFSNFRKAYYLYDSSELKSSAPDKKVEISVSPTDTFLEINPDLPKVSKKLDLVKANAQVLNEGNSFDKIEFSLPEYNNLYYEDKNGIKNVDKENLLKYKLNLNSLDGDGLTSPVEIRTKEDILLPGKVGISNISMFSGGKEYLIEKESFQRKNDFYIENGILEFYLKPTFSAGEDVLEIKIPGIETIEKKIKVNPASPRVVDISTSQESVKLGEDVSGNLKIKDVWGNIVNTDNLNLELGVLGSVGFKDNSDFKKEISFSGKEYSFDLETQKPGGDSFVYGKILGVSENQQSPDYQKINIENTLWPKKKLKIMYLNLFGSDRGNQRGYFSENEKEANKIMSNSNKNLATTTMLVDPHKIKKSDLLISNGLNILNQDKGNLSFSFSDNNIQLGFEFGSKDRVKIDLGNAQDYNIEISPNRPEHVIGNSIFYVPEPTDSYITGNVLEDKKIKINSETVLDFENSFVHKNLSFSLIDNNYSDFTVLNIKFKNKNIGKLFLNREDKYITNSYPGNVSLSENMQSVIGFAEGSTNGKKGILFYNVNNSSGEDISFKKSIEDSRDSQSNIGFREEFKNMTAFGGGETVGESTRPFSSEFLINLGDPLLSRIDKNKEKGGTGYGGGAGKRIYSGKSGIKKTLVKDFNNDGMKDVIVAYDDGAIKFLKNYGGDIPFEDLNNLMFISDGIKNIFAGDVDGNGYTDLLVRTNKDKLRVYKNNNLNFDVDGKMVCLDVPNGPNSLEDVYQTFFEDMDQDGLLDIVTNDVNGNIKIFYGGKTDGNINYVSQYSHKCGKNRKESLDQKLVKNYGVKTKDKKIYDASLLHRKGMQKREYNTSKNMASGGNIKNYQKTVNTAFQKAQEYQSLPKFAKPHYEKGLENEMTDYIIMPFLTGTDGISAYKKFIDKNGGKLKKGDTVEIKINISSKINTKVSYIENLQGAFGIPRRDDGRIDTFDKGNLSDSVFIKRNGLNDYQFMLDNIPLVKGGEVSFSYEVEYRGGKLVDIDVTKINSDKYKDIKVNPNDGCLNGYWSFKNNSVGNNRKYSEDFEDIQKKVDGYFDNKKQAKQEEIDDTKSSVQNNDLSVLEDLDGGESRSDGNFIDFSSNSQGNINNMSTNIDITLFEGMADGVMGEIGTVLRGLCKGFDLSKEGCNGGFPVPINMAFLSPGKFHSIGCSSTKDPGTPIFWFPGTNWVNCGSYPFPVPMPNKQALQGTPTEKNASPGCCCSAVWPSQLRLYVSPTLTQGVGFAACFGLYKAGMKYPTPSNSISGNCVVAATMLNQTCDEEGGGENGGNEEYVVEKRQKELANQSSCERTIYGTQRDTLPLLFFSSDDGSYTTALKGFSDPKSFRINGEDVVNFSCEKISHEEAESAILKGGKSIDLRIEGGKISGLFDCIIKKWLDKQIRYIVNNLSNMTIYVYLPDLTGWADGFGRLKDLSEIDRDMGEVGENTTNMFDSTSDSVKSGFSEIGKGNFKEGIKSFTPKDSTFEDLSTKFGNPFEQVSKFFEEVKLIDMETKDIIIRIPWMSEEELNKQITYLQGWLEKNKKTLNEWTELIKGMNCPNDLPKCKKTLQKYVDISVKIEKLINSVQKNVNILQDWAEFPMKLYDYIHIIDRYLTELSCILEEFLDGTIGWLKKNANRFEKWVDFLIVLKNIMDTRQVLIDFSVEWRSECSKCRQDNYDFYTCETSAWCPDLPVLPIPPFKLPDIYLDFSHFRAGIDILLPKFKFKPVKRPKITLPDLPSPPSVDIDINIPSIPILPKPPVLPELPSILPTVEVDLPVVIPPAPKIPPIMPQISSVVKIAKWIGKLYCIIKNGIGLVAENNVKTRIEQLTQRTRRTDPADSFELTIPEFPIMGADIRVDAYTNLKFDFKQFYNMSKSLADSINEKTNNIVKGLNLKVGEGQDSLDTIQEGVDETGIDGDYNYDVEFNGYNKTVPKKQDSLFTNVYQKIGKFKKGVLLSGYNYNQRDGMEYSQASSFLKNGLEYLREESEDYSRNKKIDKILDSLKNKTVVEANIGAVKDSVKDAQNFLDNYSNYYNDIKFKLKNNYKDLFENNANQQLISDKDLKSKEYYISLFKGDKDSIKSLSEGTSPEKEYIKLNDRILDGLNSKLESSSAKELGLTEKDYSKAKNYISHLNNTSNSLLNQTQKEKPKLSECTTCGDVSSTSSSMSTVSSTSSSVKASFDEGQGSFSANLGDYVNGFFVEGINNDYYNIISWKEKGNNLYRDKTYKKIDLNQDGKEDFILWDENEVFVKYADQNDEYKKGDVNTYDDFFVFSEFDNPESIDNLTDGNGFYSFDNKKYKISDSQEVVENFEREGQRYGSISFSWSNKNNIDAYLLRFVSRGDCFYEKNLKECSSGIPDNPTEKYVVIVDDSTDLGGTNIYDDEGAFDGGLIYDYLGGKIHDIKYKDFSKDSLSLVLENLSRNWHYAQISKLKGEKNPDNNNFSFLTKSSPWSKQLVAGNQIRGDKQSPQLEIDLIREKNGEVVSEGQDLEGYINTSYKLQAHWSDNVGINKNRAILNGKTFSGKDKSSIILQDLYYSDDLNKDIEFIAEDYVGNLHRETVSLDMKIPDINIKNINTEGTYGNISSKLSNKIDDGKVQFEKNRNGYREILTGFGFLPDGGTKGVQKSLYDIKTNTTFVTGGVFELGDDIKFYNSSKEEIGTIKVDSGKLKLQKDYQRYIDFSQGYPLLKIKDDKSKKEIFSIFLKSASLAGKIPIEIYNGNYKKNEIVSDSMGKFKGGYCIKNRNYNDCVGYISSKGDIYIPKLYRKDFVGEYSYKNSGNYIVYTIKNNHGDKIFDVKFKSEKLKK